jgi:hypothetical protein
MKILLLIALIFPILSFSQNARYDSLYHSGAIDKTEYDILTKHTHTDSTQLKLDKYDGMLKTRSITQAEYNKLTESLLNAQPGDPHYDPQFDRSKAKSSTTAGIISMVLGTIFSGIGIGTHLNNGGPYPVSIATGSLGGIALGFGMGLLINGGVLRHRANQENMIRK